MSYQFPQTDNDSTDDESSFHSQESYTMSEQIQNNGIRDGLPQNTIHEQLSGPTAFEEQQNRSPLHAEHNNLPNLSQTQYEMLYSRLKIEEDRSLLGLDRAICLGIFNSIPKEKQNRVPHWFETGGPLKNHSWVDFLNHIEQEFEDKQARQAAGNLLYRMRMGPNQYFCDFLLDFQMKLSQCGGTEWPDSSKIMKLNSSINDYLSDCLVSKDLPDDDFELWVSIVKRVAGRLEKRPSYRPKGCTGKKTWYLSHVQTRLYSDEKNQLGTSSKIDADGDTLMGGINTINTFKLLINSLKSGGSDGNHKPRAKWRSPEEFKRLVSEGKCIRCQKKGHTSRACTKFSPAINPKARVSHVKSTERPQEESENDKSENEELDDSEVSGEE
ncbi:hypothetical protein K3495_g7893 [Podosphaera aphanis]|nr:hypothetical protein K3495_g7893 [Podosphaera aphanis]